MMKGVTRVFASLLTMVATFEAGAHAFLDHAALAMHMLNREHPHPMTSEAHVH